MAQQPVTTRPSELVSTRALAAAAAASSALALVQSPAIWSALHTLALMQEATAEYEQPDEIGAALGDLLAGAMVTKQDTTQARALLESTDRTARTWCEIAHPGCRPAFGLVPVLGAVS